MSIEAITVRRSLDATSSRSRSESWLAIASNARASGTNSAGNRLLAARTDKSPSPKRLAIATSVWIGWMMIFSAATSAPNSTNTQTRQSCI